MENAEELRNWRIVTKHPRQHAFYSHPELEDFTWQEAVDRAGDIQEGLPLGFMEVWYVGDHETQLIDNNGKAWEIKG